MMILERPAGCHGAAFDMATVMEILVSSAGVMGRNGIFHLLVWLTLVKDNGKLMQNSWYLSWYLGIDMLVPG